MNHASISFDDTFEKLTSHRPFPWQQRLFEEWFSKGDVPGLCNLPTGLGKTSVIAVWLIALAVAADAPRGKRLPRRLVYVVNRRTVVDQATREAEKLRQNLSSAGLLEPLTRLCALPLEPNQLPLGISTLRGQFADNGEWFSDPARPAIIVGTVDMIGSRLLFSAYGRGFKARPLHAGLLGQDSLLVHDESHLEPAFQKLLEQIQVEQHERERANTVAWPKLCIMALSATLRANRAVVERVRRFELDDRDRRLKRVQRRLEAPKQLKLHAIEDERALADHVVRIALEYRDSGSAVLIFVRGVRDVEQIGAKLPKEATARLTGTIRGLERDRLVQSPVFQRFLPESNRDPAITPAAGTVFLVCTSAGEVGVDISADHLVCDLTPFESMAQRFGRVNRFGERHDSEIHLLFPKRIGQDGKNKELDESRQKTLALLRRLHGDASPAALDDLDANARVDAFSPEPVILPATDILFDAWAMSTIQEQLPGRPPVEPYLHGVREWEPPETYVAWREEVEIIRGELSQWYSPEDLLDDYPLKPHELLRDQSGRVSQRLSQLAQRNRDAPVWIVDSDRSVEISTLGRLASGRMERIFGGTVLLPPSVGGLVDGILSGASTSAFDVADEWYEDEQRTIRRRVRVWEDDPGLEAKANGMRRIRIIDTQPDADEAGDEESSARRFWHWYVRPRTADDDPSASAVDPIGLNQHTQDVCDNVRRIALALGLDGELERALAVAAKYHDGGKRRDVWQRSIGNSQPQSPLAKSGRRMRPLRLCPDYRHEFGSLLDVRAMNAESKSTAECEGLSDDACELVLHLIAAHHGYARPHFPQQNAYDPEHPAQTWREAASEVPRRYAGLQRKWGRWGLAYVESLLRAADWAASAKPSVVGGERARDQARAPAQGTAAEREVVA